MEAWERSATRRKLLEEANQYSSPHYEKATGLETWFAIPGMHAIVPPPRWKMAFVTFPAAYLLSLFTILILKLISASLPLTITNLVVTTVLVFGLTYFAMPTLSVLLKRWLYPP